MKRFGIPRRSVRPTTESPDIPLLGVEETLTVAALKRGGKKMSFVALSPVGRRRLPSRVLQFQSFIANVALSASDATEKIQYERRSIKHLAVTALPEPEGRLL